RRRWPLAVLALAALGGVAWWWRPLPPPHTPGTPLPDTDVAVESAAPPGTTAAPAEAVAVTTQGHEDATATTPPADACAVLAELPRLPDMAARVAAGSDTPRYAIDTIKLYGPGDAAYTRLLEDAGGELEARRATLAATHGAGNRLSAADIEALAELLTDTARERGLLATAIAPMQFLDAHELALTVLPWRFGAVRLSGVPSEFRAANQAVAARVLGAALADAPRAHSLKRALLATILDNDFHGSAFAVLEPGATLASFDVVLKWQDAKPAFDPATVDVDRLYIYAVAGSGIRLPVTQVGDADAVPGGADVDDYARQVVDLFAPLAGEPALDCRRQALLGAYRDAARERVATGTGDDIADSRPR
ncbi:MAG: hypothetical protein KDK06_20510, partial [Gammaproteobacteria bacterium]|nr:hypothetical protein [Gammaproteobacteria bacterium]